MILGLARRGWRGVTLVEVLIASSILGVVALAAISITLAASRGSRDAIYDMMALELVNREIERLRSEGDFAQRGDATHANPLFVNSATFPYDPQFTDAGPEFTVNYEWFGFGRVASGSANSITFDASGWPDVGELPDMTLSFLTLPESGQIVRITDFSISDGVGTFTFNADIYEVDANPRPITVAPVVNERFYVDYGKWVHLTIEWTEPDGDQRSLPARTVFIRYEKPRF